MITEDVPAQPYHAAENLSFKQAERLIRRSEAVAERLAERAIREILNVQAASSREIRACALLLSSARPQPALAKTLASHALIHAAEGELFRIALARASEKCGLEVVGIRERDLFDEAERKLHIDQDALARRITDMGRDIGRPWMQDEKRATLAAWMAL